MHRRLALQALGVLLATGSASAQPAPTKRRIGILVFLPNADFERGVLKAMSDVGYVEGRNLEIVRRSGEGKAGGLAKAAAELVAERVDLIVLWSTDAAEAARRATTTVPVLFIVADPLGSGLVKSLARPEANLTGVSSLSFDFVEKHVGLLVQAMPQSSKFGFLGLRGEANLMRFFEIVRSAAGRAKVDLQLVEVADVRSIEPAVQAAKRDGIQGLVLQPIFYPQSAEVAAILLKHRMPATGIRRGFTAAGGFMSFGPVPEESFTRLASQARRIFAGATPANVPVEQITRSDFSINLRTAKALGIELSPQFLGRADEVIE